MYIPRPVGSLLGSLPGAAGACELAGYVGCSGLTASAVMATSINVVTKLSLAGENCHAIS